MGSSELIRLRSLSDCRHVERRVRLSSPLYCRIEPYWNQERRRCAAPLAPPGVSAGLCALSGPSGARRAAASETPT